MIFDNLPERLSSNFPQSLPDEDVYICDVPVVAKLGGEELSGPGELFLTWHPSPRLSVRTQIVPDDIVALQFFAGGGAGELSVSGVEGDWRLIHPSPIRGIAFRTNPPFVTDLVKVHFHLVNFANYSGTMTRVGPLGSTTMSAGRLTLTSDRWHVILDGTESIGEKVKIMNRMGGYAITHVGRLSQISGAPFSSDEAQEFLRSFARFLSFVQGRWVTPILVQGFSDDGNQIWAHWKTQSNIGSWQYVDSWFEPLQAVEILPPVFSGFSALIEDPAWRTVVSRAAYWYILANSTKDFEPSLILAQAALELLTWQTLVRQKGMSKSTFKKKSAAEKIRSLLKLSGIPSRVPQGLTSLARFAQGNGIDGPTALARIRNTLVHPGKRAAGNLATAEARQLGLWYTELILLKLFNYSGRYGSRVLGHPRSAGQLELVPWMDSEP